MLRSKLILLPALGLLALACGGRSDLDDYTNGLASVVPRTSHEFPTQGEAPARSDEDTLLPVGSACSEADECGTSNAHLCMEQVAALTFFSMKFPGGMCTFACTSDRDCPEDSACIIDFDTPRCLPLCDSASDCRTDEGYACARVPGSEDKRNFCVPKAPIPGL